MSNDNIPIKMATGRKLLIEKVADPKAYSARRLSFNAKELQFVSEEFSKWLTEMYGSPVDSDLTQSLNSGVILLSIIEQHMPSVKSIQKWHQNATPGSFYARDNIRTFANVCVELGMRRSDVINYSSFEKGDLKQIIATLSAFAHLGIPKGLTNVSEELQPYVEKAYTPKPEIETVVEEEIHLTEEELEEIEKKIKEDEERQIMIMNLKESIKEREQSVNAHYEKVMLLVQMDSVEVEQSTDSSSSSEEEDEEKEERKRIKKSIKSFVRATDKESVERVCKELESAVRNVETDVNEVSLVKTELKEIDVDVLDIEAVEKEMKLMKKAIEERYKYFGKEMKKREEEERIAKEEAERLAKEEAERLAKEEAERLAKEEAERLAKEEAERLAKEEAERLAKEEAERLAKEEAERLAKEEAERLAKEEAERLAKEEAERLAREKEEERIQAELLETQREEEERLAREEEEANRRCGCRAR